MARYDYFCVGCGVETTKLSPIADRDKQVCDCSSPLTRVMAAPVGRVIGRADGKPRPGGADQFTADAMGLNLKDLPTHLKEKGPGAI